MSTLLAFRTFLVVLLMSCSLWVAADVPNILLILTDDLGYGDLGVYYQNYRRAQGLPGFHTPHLDQLAQSGVRMDRHYVPSPICAPTRATMLTGRHQGHSEVRDNESLSNRPIEDNHTLATLLRDAGYATAIIGKWGVGGQPADNFPGHPLLRGFDFFFGPLEHGPAHYHYPTAFDQPFYENFTLVTPQLAKAYSTDLFTGRAKKWIVDHHTEFPDQPFFLYLNYTAPHPRLEIPTQAYPSGGGIHGGVQWTGTPGAIINTATGTMNSWLHPDYANQSWPNFAKYHATMVRRLDDAMGDLVKLLEDLDLADNTLIIFTSDNGPHHESGREGGNFRHDPSFLKVYGPLDGTKRDVFEGGIRVPAIVSWPGTLPAGRVSTHPTQQHDWLPTLVERAGVPVPFRADGVSLWNELTGEGPLPDHEVYVEYTTRFHYKVNDYVDFMPERRNRDRGHMQAIYLNGFKGVRYNVQGATDVFEVYDTLNDPGERVNLAGQPGVPTQTQFQDKVFRMRRPHTGADPTESPPRPYDGEPVPSLALPAPRQGLEVKVYEADFPHVTKFRGLDPVVVQEVSGLDLSVMTRPQDIGLAFEGWLDVPVTGDYEFFLTTDTGAGMRIHEILVLDADAGYAPGTERSSGPMRLQAGQHPLRIHTRHDGGEAMLSLAWSGPGIVKQAVPANAFVLPGDPGAPTAPSLGLATHGPNPVQAEIHPFTLPENWEVHLTRPPHGGSVERVERLWVYTPHAGVYGEDFFEYTVSDGEQSSSGRITVEVRYVDPTRLWLPLNEGEGAVAHDAGGRPSAQIHGAPQWVEGVSGHALHLNGTSDHLVVNPGFTVPAGSSPRSVSAWIRPQGPGSIAGWGLNETGRKWHFRLDNNTGFVNHLRVEVAGGYRRGATRLENGEWVHVAAVLPENANNVNQVLLYFNGKEDLPYDTQAQGMNTAVTPIEIGTDNHPSPRFFPGSLDEVRIMHRAMSSEEIAALAETPNQTANAWHLRHFGDVPIVWMADDLGDGSSRLERLAMGWNPWSQDRPGLLRIESGDGETAVCYTRSGLEFLPLKFVVEGSEDLDQWDELTPVEVTQEDENGRVNVREILPQPEDLQFYRLRFRLNDAE
ncbi:MAG: sulfatase-like hydrolase/transferase [Verrucomicrobia bacterium]|nr:sulfatase-like hydrolase/transferase [Verrucomicrobiota bacterium]MCH8510164.1 sulfatase-like hydrolase/transferase [Kiritimatiellia bacterium]